jgi:hypothetical protein
MQIVMKDKESIATSEPVFHLHGADRLPIKTITKGWWAMIRFRDLYGRVMSTDDLSDAATDCRVLQIAFSSPRTSPLSPRSDAFALSPNRKISQLEDGPHAAVGVDQ